jgi:hypothetical protein
MKCNVWLVHSAPISVKLMALSTERHNSTEIDAIWACAAPDATKTGPYIL